LIGGAIESDIITVLSSSGMPEVEELAVELTVEETTAGYNSSNEDDDKNNKDNKNKDDNDKDNKDKDYKYKSNKENKDKYNLDNNNSENDDSSEDSYETFIEESQARIKELVSQLRGADNISKAKILAEINSLNELKKNKI
jgi:hypothetical protein